MGALALLYSLAASGDASYLRRMGTIAPRSGREQDSLLMEKLTSI
jgi:hypothetical protein